MSPPRERRETGAGSVTAPRPPCQQAGLATDPARGRSSPVASDSQVRRGRAVRGSGGGGKLRDPRAPPPRCAPPLRSRRRVAPRPLRPPARLLSPPGPGGRAAPPPPAAARGRGSASAPSRAAPRGLRTCAPRPRLRRAPPVSPCLTSSRASIDLPVRW